MVERVLCEWDGTLLVAYEESENESESESKR